MKLTDLALIFVAVFLPVVIIVYVNTSFVVKAEKQEMYYKNMINSAITDAVSSMKQIENKDKDIDYGYSGIIDKKVSINEKIAIDTFINSLVNNFNIANNENAIKNLKMNIPAIAVLDYDGIYIHSAEEDEAGEVSFITKPKVYYTYTYALVKEINNLTREETYDVVNVSDIDNLKTKLKSLVSQYIYEINFTMDDYIYLNIYNITDNVKLGDVVYSKGFYLNDSINNNELVYENNLASDIKSELLNKIIDHLGNMRLKHISEIAMKEISYAVNKHNIYAKEVGISYKFKFYVESDNEWYETMDGIGMIAVIQGISLGNRYLNYRAYGTADLTRTTNYYVTKDINIEGKDLAYLSKDLYHISKKCRVYLEYINSTNKKIVPNSYTSKAEAATHGYYACPVCKP